jgi:ubiquinone/menaquinone biosynthesis C-methylase UbiE
MSDKLAADGLTRIMETYEKRDSRAGYADWRNNVYHHRHDLGALFHAQTQSALARALNLLQADLESSTILDYGCGTGSWLRMLIDMGAQPNRTVGVDLSAQRLAYAAAQTRGAGFSRVGGQLPFRDNAFDLVIVSLVFSSVEDPRLHIPLALELERVAKTQGALIWLDMDHCHGNLHGFGRGDLKRLFPGREAIRIDRLHPAYFRRFYRHARIMSLTYSLTRAACESTLYVLLRADDDGAQPKRR